MKYLTLPQVKKLLEKAQKERELSYIQKLALEQAQKLSKLTLTKSESLVEELKKIERITEPLAYKIADLLPSTLKELRAVFVKERFSLSSEELNSILELVKKYKG
ncbi:MAG: RNA polymerase Rpb4 family protein [Candidatus Thermoplasmatota archaeon]|nr:RNA polymerase Rpb4 family protein [Candidatus Thermoplasmatota archaeon]MDI6887569.1 RNA polymerase Rpb4 family protein [Candidatus Thermoplasmatota archaeon]